MKIKLWNWQRKAESHSGTHYIIQSTSIQRLCQNLRKPDDAKESKFSPENFDFLSMFRSSQDQCNQCSQTETSKTVTNTRKHLLNAPDNVDLPWHFGNIDEEKVSKASSLTKGTSGLSQLDPMQYYHLLSSLKYKVEDKELETQIAFLARK